MDIMKHKSSAEVLALTELKIRVKEDLKRTLTIYNQVLIQYKCRQYEYK
jgi:hypothetical protein